MSSSLISLLSQSYFSFVWLRNSNLFVYSSRFDLNPHAFMWFHTQSGMGILVVFLCLWILRVSMSEPSANPGYFWIGPMQCWHVSDDLCHFWWWGLHELQHTTRTRVYNVSCSCSQLFGMSLYLVVSAPPRFLAQTGMHWGTVPRSRPDAQLPVCTETWRGVSYSTARAIFDPFNTMLHFCNVFPHQRSIICNKIKLVQNLSNSISIKITQTIKPLLP